jgi:branched-chain amino acid aminotransferase
MKLPLSKYVWFDGEYVLTEKAQVPITTHAIHYGIGMEKISMYLD